MEFLIMERQAHIDMERQWQAPIYQIGGLYGSPLQAASAMGSIAAVRLLLQHNADVNIGNEHWGSSLQAAVAGGRSEIVELLLQHGANPCTKGGRWNSPLLQAASLPGPSRPAEFITRVLLDAGASIHDTTAIRRETAVHLASSHGCQEVLSLLLRAGADANIVDDWDHTALHYASLRGCESIIESLLEYGADIDSASSDVWTPLYYAAGTGEVECVKTLLDRGANINARSKCPGELGWTPLHVAADAGYDEAVKLLLDKGADIEAIADNLYTPLHLAAFKNHHRCVQLLLSYGANTEAKCGDGNVTALYLAVTEESAAFRDFVREEYSAFREHYVSTVKELLDWKADVTTANSDNGWTILHLAVRCGYAPIAKLILEFNAPLEPLDEEGDMPIHTAVWEEQHDTLQLLLDFGAAVDVEDSDGRSALILAAGHGSLTAVKILLRGGANIDKQTPTGQTACIEAIRIQAPEVAEYLIEMGADPAIMDAYGRSYFDWVAALDWDGFENTPSPPSEERIVDPTLIEITQNNYISLVISDIKGLAEVDGANISRHVELLGRLLIQRKQFDDACTAFERSSSHRRRDEQEWYYCNRDKCFKRLGGDLSLTSRFVCCVCTDVDFCESCMQEYNIEGEIETGITTLERCTRHTLLKVPSPEWLQLPSGKVNRAGETELEWLDRLLRTHSPG